MPYGWEGNRNPDIALACVTDTVIGLSVYGTERNTQRALLNGV